MDPDPMIRMDPDFVPHLHTGIDCNCPNSNAQPQGRIEITTNENRTVNLLKIPKVSDVVDSPLVLITMCVMLSLYLIGLIICRIFDKLDERKNLGLTIMADLSESSTSKLYLITVESGCNFWAGTTSSVGLFIFGSLGNSQIITIKDKSASVLNRGGVDTYLISCSKDLGQLQSVRIWTDSSGSDPSWYCRKIGIRCIETNECWNFHFNQWLRVTRETPTAVAEVSATKKTKRRKFSIRFKENLFQQFDHANLWLSLFRYSPASSFTRCERLTCAVGTLTVFTLCNIWYLGTKDSKTDQKIKFPYRLLKIGDFTLDADELLYSLQIALITTPLGNLMVVLFRNITPRVFPTLLIWDNVIPAKMRPKRNSIFIPHTGDHDNFLQRSLLKRVQISENSDTSPSKPESSEALSNTSSSSDFNIPATDVSRLEEWIKGRSTDQNRHHPHNSHKMDGGGDGHHHHRPSLTQDEEAMVEDAYSSGQFTNSMDLTEVMEEGRMTNDLVRLGRHSMINAILDYHPSAFIFRGDHSVHELEILIDNRIREMGQGGNIDTNKNSQEDHPTSISKNTPWKKRVTKEYLKELARMLEEDMEYKFFLQDEGSWKTHKLAELCMLPPLSKPCFHLPWWCIVTSWIFCVAIIIISTYYTIVLGVNYSYDKSLKWIETFINDIIVSILIAEPLNDLLEAFIATLLGQQQPIPERLQVIPRDSSNADFLRYRVPYKFTIFKPGQVGLPTQK